MPRPLHEHGEAGTAVQPERDRAQSPAVKAAWVVEVSRALEQIGFPMQQRLQQ